MAEKHADQGFRKLPQTLKPMTWKERFDHLWEYYRFTFFMVGAAIILSIALVVDIVVTYQVELFAGVTINVTVSEEGAAKLNEDMLEIYEGKPERKETVTLTTGTPALPEEEQNMVQIYAELMRVVSQITAGDIDYLLADKSGLDYFLGAEAGENLNLLVSEEFMKELEPYIVWGTLEGETNIPVAVSIAHTEFAKSCVRNGEALYVMFPGNTGRNERIEPFLRYLLGN